ncbi:hypothetical protein ykris0001_10550 [Yersinia kristensenii ATCC 33638]|nr:hypothetical protein ykris0001_10550 [Yersinia kristensenii ATCC 33638]
MNLNPIFMNLNSMQNKKSLSIPLLPPKYEFDHNKNSQLVTFCAVNTYYYFF